MENKRQSIKSEVSDQTIEMIDVFKNLSVSSYMMFGEYLFLQGKFTDAAKIYVQFLTQIKDKVHHFKAFADFWKKFSEHADKDEVRKIYDEIVNRFNNDEFSASVKREILFLLYNVFPDETGKDFLIEHSRISQWIRQKDKDKKTWDVYCMLLWQEKHAVHSRESVQKDKYLVSVMEKYELYALAIKMIEHVLRYDKDEVAVRTLFRLCRKVNDYSKADIYVAEHPDIEKRTGFNIQYELVYYYLEKGDETKLMRTLKNIKANAESSLPISRTLQNFYVKIGMIDEAVAMRGHISRLEQRAGRLGADKKVKGLEEERETDDFFWDTIKDMVSEQEHNRQLIAIKEMLKGFSHELGQPITNIRYGIQLYQMKMECGLDTRENLSELLNNILGQTIRVKRLLTRFAPIVSSKSVNTQFNCIEHIKNAFSDMRAWLESAGIKYKVEGIESFILYGDSVQFEQVIYNLISNAVDELKEKEGKRSINVICKEHEGNLVLHFRDNGKGVPEDNLNKIFTPFFSTKDKERSDGGEGLGLYIVWNILKMYKGKIRVNQAYKDGAEFLIQIPAGGNDNA